MQINLNKKTGTLLGVIVVLVLALVFFFAGNTNMSMNHDGHGSMIVMTKQRARTLMTS